MNKIKIREAIVVEGRYDKNALSQLVDAVILETRGFSIFNDREIISLLRFYAESRGLVVLTDSDGAGFMIRNKIKGLLAPDKLKQAYIPDIRGKEKRKRRPSSENKLGVEGMEPEVIIGSLLRAGATIEADDGGSEETGAKKSKPALYTKADFYDMGLSGRPDSASKRARISRALGLPEKLGSDGLLDAVNTLASQGYTLEALLEANRKDDAEQ
jgi:ribonuclease M5